MERPLFADLSAALGLFFIWSLAQILFLVLDIPPAAATAQVLLVGLLFAARYVLPAGDPAQIERRVRSRVRPLGAQWPWTIVSALALALLLTTVVGLYTRFIPPAEVPNAALDAYLKLPYGGLPLFAGVVIVDPLVDEVIFRGWVQSRLTRAFGPETAIINAAALFAIANLDPWRVPPLFLLGLAGGYSVYLTRSIWSAVLIHLAFKAAWYAADSYWPDFDLATGPFGDARGLAMGIGLIVIAAAVTAVAFHRQRILRDAESERRAADAASAGPDVAD